MRATDIPVKFPIPWASNANANFTRPIPVLSQQSISAGAASLQDGFPPNTFTQVQAGGSPPDGRDENGILNQITAWLRWIQGGGGLPVFDAAFVAAPPNGMGGYPAGAVLASTTLPGVTYVSAVDNNTTNPDSAQSAGWIGNGLTFGDLKWRPTQENLSLQGWVMGNATTIGSANSLASQLASSICQNLYGWFWSNFSQSQCPVTGGRGTSALSDFNSNKPIQTLDMRGIGITGMDTMGGATTTKLNGVPVSNGAANIAGSLIGENLHALIIAELAAHLHGINITDLGHLHQYTAFGAGGFGANASAPQTSGSQGNTSTNTTGISATAQSTGSGTAHNNVPLALTGTWYFKL